MKNHLTFTSADYDPEIINLIGQLPATRIEFDLVQVNNHGALVLDAYGLGNADLDSWVTKLKAMATPGAIYAYDHRVNGHTASELPEISLMFEGIKSLGELSMLINEHNVETAQLVEEAMHDARTQAVRKLDESLDGMKTAKSARLLAFATAF